MDKKISAKDRAFEKERIKYRQKIREVENELKEKDTIILSKDVEIENLNQKIKELKEWNNRLLEFMDMDEEEFKRLRENQESMQKAREAVSMIFNASRMFPI